MTSTPSSQRSSGSSESFDTYLGSLERYVKSLDDRRAGCENQVLPLRQFEPGPEFEQRGFVENEAREEENNSNSGSSFEKMEYMHSLGLRTASLSISNDPNMADIQTNDNINNDLSTLSNTPELITSENPSNDQCHTTDSVMPDVTMNVVRTNEVQDKVTSSGVDTNLIDTSSGLNLSACTTVTADADVEMIDIRHENNDDEKLKDLEDVGNRRTDAPPDTSSDLTKIDNNVVNPVVSELMEKIYVLDKDALEDLLCEKFASMASLSSKYSELEARFSGLKTQLEEEVQKKSEAIEELQRELDKTKPAEVKKSVGIQVDLPIETLEKSTSPEPQSDSGPALPPEFILPDSVSNDVPTEGNETTDDSDVMISPDIELIVVEDSETQSLPDNNNAEFPIGNNHHVSNGIEHVQVVSSGLRFVPMQQLLQNPEMPSTSSVGVSPPRGTVPTRMVFQRPSPLPSPIRRPRHPRPPRLPGSNQNVHYQGNLRRVPQKPDVTLSRLRGGTDVKVAWKIRSPPSCAPIALFEIYEFHGKPEGEGPSDWRLIGEEPFNGSLSGAVIVKDFLPRTKYHFAIRAKDVHGRVGNFSDIREIKDVMK